MAKKKKDKGRVKSAQPSDYVKEVASKKRKREENSYQSSSSSTSSLAQLLKKKRGVAADTPAPPIYKDKLGRAFLTPDDDKEAFDACLKTSFKGFYFDTPSSLPSDLHRDFNGCFDGLETGGLFLYDIVQPGRKKLTRTLVTRTLVGDPGSTYKYLGLRLFSHPWIDVDGGGNSLQLNKKTHEGSSLTRLGYSTQTAKALIVMGRLNEQLAQRSTLKLQQLVSVKPLVGSADFNLTLVNKMDPTSTKRDLKREGAYNMGKTSVGWHRDSGLKDFSTIAVYQTHHPQGLSSNNSSTNQPWGVALRCCDGGTGGPLTHVPALKVALPSGSLYYMLDDFNHNHEHAVIAGDDGVRYSSTHRVAREGQGTWQYIRDKTQTFLSSSKLFDWHVGKMNDSTLSHKKRKEKMVSRLRNQEALMSEIEFEWLRQWYVQGRKHASLHPYWHNPIKILAKSYSDLEKTTATVIKLLRQVSERGPADSDDVCETLYDVLIEAFTERDNRRKEWDRRLQDNIFRNMAENERPFACPCLDNVSTDLDASIKELRELRSAFVTYQHADLDGSGGGDKSKEKKEKKKKKKKSLTRKEEKKVASNWNALKTKLSRGS